MRVWDIVNPEDLKAENDVAIRSDPQGNPLNTVCLLQTSGVRDTWYETAKISDDVDQNLFLGLRHLTAEKGEDLDAQMKALLP
jgi:hypothetical protein